MEDIIELLYSWGIPLEDKPTIIDAYVRAFADFLYSSDISAIENKRLLFRVHFFDKDQQDQVATILDIVFSADIPQKELRKLLSIGFFQLMGVDARAVVTKVVICVGPPI